MIKLASSDKTKEQFCLGMLLNNCYILQPHEKIIIDMEVSVSAVKLLQLLPFYNDLEDKYLIIYTSSAQCSTVKFRYN